MNLLLQKPSIQKIYCTLLFKLLCKLEIIFMQTKFFGNLKFGLCKILSCRKILKFFEKETGTSLSLPRGDNAMLLAIRRKVNVPVIVPVFYLKAS